MDIDLELTVKDTFKNAFHRIDGLFMYLVAGVFAVQALVFLFTDGWMAFSTTPREKLVWSSGLLIPLTFLFYISLATYSSHGKISRSKNALFILLIPILFYWKLF